MSLATFFRTSLSVLVVVVALQATQTVCAQGFNDYNGEASTPEIDNANMNAPPGMYFIGDTIDATADATASVAAGHGSQGFFRLRVLVRDSNSNILSSASTLREILPGQGDELDVTLEGYTAPALTEFYVDAVLTVSDPAAPGNPLDPTFELVSFASAMMVLDNM